MALVGGAARSSLRHLLKVFQSGIGALSAPHICGCFPYTDCLSFSMSRFTILWAVIGLALEPMHDFLVELTPAIEQGLESIG